MDRLIEKRDVLIMQLDPVSHFHEEEFFQKGKASCKTHCMHVYCYFLWNISVLLF